MKKIISNILLGGVIAVTAFVPCSCSDSLDVSDEVTQNLTVEEVFENPGYARRWHAGLFNCISRYDNSSSAANNGFTGIWCHISGETLVTSGTLAQVMVSGFNAGDAGWGQRWSKLYTQIRDAYVFIDNVHVIGSVTDKETLTEEEVLRMRAEAKFLIAYSYFSLYELYGPVPFLGGAVAVDDPNLDFARTPNDEFLTQVDNMLREVIESGDLPETLVVKEDISGNDRYRLSEIVRPTKTAALALRAKMWVYAASPLFNGGYDEALEITNTDGRRIFTVADRTKWEKARECLEDLLADADSKGHKLYEVNGSDGKLDPHRSIYELFQSYNDEILWATGYNDYSHEGWLENNTWPRSMPNGWANICVTQNTVDAFFDVNGLAIDDPGTVYNPTGFHDMANPTNEKKLVDWNIHGMYVNREPRFYAGVTYEGKGWYIEPWRDYKVEWAKGENADNSSASSPRTGYLLAKYNNRSILPVGDHIREWARPSILFRLADFYLYYAEVLNEIDPSNPDIITYLDKVRHRAGIPGYKELRERGMKDIIGDQDKQRKAIHHERRVELFAEGQRYFDVRRWMVCDAGQEGDQTVIWGMNMNGDRWKNYQPGPYYDRTVIERRAWRRAMYLFPIPDSEIQKSKNRLLVQNPLW